MHTSSASIVNMWQVEFEELVHWFLERESDVRCCVPPPSIPTQCDDRRLSYSYPRRVCYAAPATGTTQGNRMGPGATDGASDGAMPATRGCLQLRADADGLLRTLNGVARCAPGQYAEKQRSRIFSDTCQSSGDTLGVKHTPVLG